MWAYIPAEVEDHIKSNYLTAGKLYEITEIRKGSFRLFDDVGRSVFALSRHCAQISGHDWRIVLKPRIRRMGVVG